MFRKKNILIVLLLLLFSVPAIYSLLHFGFFASDDGEWMIIRFSAFYQAFRDGQIPVRFLGRLNNGFGYPVANFLYPGFMYLGIPIHLVGFGFVSTIKIILGLSMVGSSLFSYLWLTRLFNKYSAFVGSLFYLYTPYHLFDLYKRGSVGEVLALSIVPFILWQIERKSLFFSSLGIAALILSHNTLAILFLPLIIIYSFISNYSKGENKKYLILNTLYSILFGLGLSSFFWIPALFGLSFTNFSNTKISNINEYFAWFNLIGLSSIAVLVFSGILFYKFKASSVFRIRENLFFLFFAVGIFSIIYSIQISEVFWKVLPSSFVQFPFRLLSHLILSVSFLSAYIIFQLRDFRKYLVTIALTTLLIYSAFNFLTPSEFFEKPEGLYATNEGTTTVKDEYMPKWVKQKPMEHYKEKLEIISGKGEVSNLSYNSKRIFFNFNSQTDSKIKINTIYYPGWRASINGRGTEVQYDNNQGVMELSVPKGNHQINLSFSETPLRLLADTLSLLSFAVLIIFIINTRKVII